MSNQIEWSAEFCEIPSPDKIPKLRDRSLEPIQLPGGQMIQIPDMSQFGLHDRLNQNYLHKLANYEFVKRLAKKVRLVVTNTGDAPANDVRLEITVSKELQFGIFNQSDIPDAPKRRKSILETVDLRNLRIRPPFARTGYVHIEKSEHETKTEIDCGNLQPGRKVWTDEFHMAVFESGKLQIHGSLFAANLSKSQEFSLSINAQINRTQLTVDQLNALDEMGGNEE